jgi:hypothetical protein
MRVWKKQLKALLNPNRENSGTFDDQDVSMYEEDVNTIDILEEDDIYSEVIHIIQNSSESLSYSISDTNETKGEIIFKPNQINKRISLFIKDGSNELLEIRFDSDGSIKIYEEGSIAYTAVASYSSKYYYIRFKWFHWDGSDIYYCLKINDEVSLRTFATTSSTLDTMFEITVGSDDTEYYFCNHAIGSNAANSMVDIDVSNQIIYNENDSKYYWISFDGPTVNDTETTVRSATGVFATETEEHEVIASGSSTEFKSMASNIFDGDIYFGFTNLSHLKVFQIKYDQSSDTWSSVDISVLNGSAGDYGYCLGIWNNVDQSEIEWVVSLIDTNEYVRAFEYNNATETHSYSIYDRRKCYNGVNYNDNFYFLFVTGSVTQRIIEFSGAATETLYLTIDEGYNPSFINQTTQFFYLRNKLILFFDENRLYLSSDDGDSWSYYNSSNSSLFAVFNKNDMDDILDFIQWDEYFKYSIGGKSIHRIQNTSNFEDIIYGINNLFISYGGVLKLQFIDMSVTHGILRRQIETPPKCKIYSSEAPIIDEYLRLWSDLDGTNKEQIYEGKIVKTKNDQQEYEYFLKSPIEDDLKKKIQISLSSKSIDYIIKYIIDNHCDGIWYDSNIATTHATTYTKSFDASIKDIFKWCCRTAGYVYSFTPDNEMIAKDFYDNSISIDETSSSKGYLEKSYDEFVEKFSLVILYGGFTSGSRLESVLQGEPSFGYFQDTFSNIVSQSELDALAVEIESKGNVSINAFSIDLIKYGFIQEGSYSELTSSTRSITSENYNVIKSKINMRSGEQTVYLTDAFWIPHPSDDEKRDNDITQNQQSIAKLESDVNGGGTIAPSTIDNDLEITGSLTLGGHAVDDINIATEFTDDDSHIMTAAAILDKINTAAITAVEGEATLDLSGSLSVGSNLDVNGNTITFGDGNYSQIYQSSNRIYIESVASPMYFVADDNGNDGAGDRFLWYEGDTGTDGTKIMALDESGNLDVIGTLNIDERITSDDDSWTFGDTSAGTKYLRIDKRYNGESHFIIQRGDANPDLDIWVDDAEDVYINFNQIDGDKSLIIQNNGQTVFSFESGGAVRIWDRDGDANSYVHMYYDKEDNDGLRVVTVQDGDYVSKPLYLYTGSGYQFALYNNISENVTFAGNVEISGTINPKDGLNVDDSGNDIFNCSNSAIQMRRVTYPTTSKTLDFGQSSSFIWDDIYCDDLHEIGPGFIKLSTKQVYNDFLNLKLKPANPTLPNATKSTGEQELDLTHFPSYIINRERYIKQWNRKKKNEKILMMKDIDKKEGLEKTKEEYNNIINNIKLKKDIPKKYEKVGLKHPKNRHPQELGVSHGRWLVSLTMALKHSEGIIENQKKTIEKLESEIQTIKDHLEYCKDCGTKLKWKEDEITLERIGWKCPICEKEWMDEKHDDIIPLLIRYINEIRSELGLEK